MKKKMENNFKDLKGYCELSEAIRNNPDTALEVLWELKVQPSKVLAKNKLFYVDTESEEFKELCKQLENENEKLLLPSISEEELPIKNPVVRDIIGKKCRSFLKATADQALIHKVIHLLRSERENQFCGGLKALDFNYQEASYIKETCNGDDISLYLSHLFYGTANEKKENEGNEKKEEKEKEEIKNSSNISIPSSVLLSNRELVEEFFHIAKENSLSAEVLISKRELIMAFFETCDKLSKKGIDIKYLIEKEGKIKEIFAMLDEL